MPPAQASSTSFASDAAAVRGSTEPRIWTPPLRELTPDTSDGFAVVEFSRDVLRRPLDPWQEWLAIHGLELLPDGRPRFRKLLVIVARQNGKTELLVVLSLFWMFVDAVPLILGTSTKTNYAKESMLKAVALAESVPELNDLHDQKWTFTGAGAEEAVTRERSRYKVAAANASGGRSLTVHRLILDELRTHHHYAAWDSAVPAGNAVRDFQVWALTNMGDDRSVVLNDLRAAAFAEIESGGHVDSRMGIFEWSCEDGADPLDVDQLARANPNLGWRIDADTLLGDARTAVAKGGEMLNGFKTENMCIRVKMLDPAIDAAAWRRCLEPGSLDGVRSRVTVCLDVAPDQRHATLVAAAVLDDGRVRVDPVRAWDGRGCTDELRRDLPGLLRRIKPKALGWFPIGPAASLAADLAERKGRTQWPPRGIAVDEIRGEVSAACMGFAEQVTNERVVHSDDPLLNAHVTGAERLRNGDSWKFSRRGEGHCDAAYAAAGAVHLARTLPTSVGKPRLLSV